MPKFTKATRQAMRGKERKGPFEPDPSLNRIIPTAGGMSCYFLSFENGSTKKYLLDSPEFMSLMEGLTLPQRRRIREEVKTLVQRYPDSNWPWVLDELLQV
jgi:hypothetical protein